MAVAEGAAGIIAIGVNCTAPHHVPALLTAAQAVTDLPLIAYPNGGDAWDATARRWVAADADGVFNPPTVAGWASAGAIWLGGCCGTGPADIARLRAVLDSAASAASVQAGG